MKNNNTMMMDLYELTMAQTYFNEGKSHEEVCFDGFFRTIPFEGGYALMGGVDEVIDYIKNLHFTEEDIEELRGEGLFTEEFLKYLSNFRFTGDIYMVEDGTPIFGNEPILTVKAPLIEAQIIETTLLSFLNATILFTTAAKRMTEAAGDIPIMEFGARRANGPEAAILASKYSIIGGCVGTSNILAGKQNKIPKMGTMAHSFVMEYPTEYDAFLSYAKTFPNHAVFLVDTYDTLKSGIPNAIRVAKEFLIPGGYTLKGIRIDSGDLAFLSKETRKLLDEAGLYDTKICVSNGLTPETIRSLKQQGAVIDSIGAGDNIAAPKERVGCVYKLVEKDGIPTIKVSEDAVKTINPGYKKVYRFYDKKTGYALGDVLALQDEIIPKNTFTLMDPNNTLNQKEIKDYFIRELQVPIFKKGKCVYQNKSVLERREYCNQQMGTLYPEIKRDIKPHQYYVDLTMKLLTLKKEMLQNYKEDLKNKVYQKV